MSFLRERERARARERERERERHTDENRYRERDRIYRRHESRTACPLTSRTSKSQATLCVSQRTPLSPYALLFRFLARSFSVALCGGPRVKHQKNCHDMATSTALAFRHMLQLLPRSCPQDAGAAARPSVGDLFCKRQTVGQARNLEPLINRTPDKSH